MNQQTLDKLYELKDQRSELVDEYTDELKKGCDCGYIEDKIQEIQRQIFYIEFTGREYLPKITPTELQVITEGNIVNPYIFRSSDYFLEDFVDTIECQGAGNFTISLTSVVGQKNREINIINSSSATISISAVSGELIGNNGDSQRVRQVAVGDSITLKSNGIFTWRIS